jgi:hypothetical protein
MLPCDGAVIIMAGAIACKSALRKMIANDCSVVSFYSESTREKA